MSEDDVTAPESEADEPEDQEVTDAEEGDELSEGEEEGEGDEQEAEPELEEIEYEGKTFRVPPELKKGLMLNADYTRKTQEVADQRKALESDRQALVQQAQAQQQNIRDYAQIEALTQRIAEYDKIDWQSLNSQDPVKAQSLWIQLGQLKDQRATLATTLHQKEQERTLTAQREAARRNEEGQAVLRKEIPNWGPELASKLKDFAVSNGFTAQEVEQVVDPRTVKILNLAYVGAQLAEKQRTAIRKPKAEAKPVPSVSTKGKPDNRLRDDISTEEWVRRRNAQIAARGR